MGAIDFFSVFYRDHHHELDTKTICPKEHTWKSVKILNVVALKKGLSDSVVKAKIKNKKSAAECKDLFNVTMMTTCCHLYLYLVHN